MIIIGTKTEIEVMIKGGCPHMVKHNVSCDQDCWECWNRSASIVIVRQEKIGMIENDIDGVSFLEYLKESEEVSKYEKPNKLKNFGNW